MTSASSTLPTELELNTTWLRCLQTKDDAGTTYHPPILSFHTMNYLRLCCDVLQQSLGVFILASDILSSYIRAQNDQFEPVPDGKTPAIENNALLLILSSLFVASKCLGSDSFDVAPAHIQGMYGRMAREGGVVTVEDIRRTELMLIYGSGIEISTTTTRLNDMHTCLAAFIQAVPTLSDHINPTDLRDIADQILQICQIQEVVLFQRIQEIYEERCSTADVTVNEIMNVVCGRKLYLPGGVILVAVSVTNYCMEISRKVLYGRLMEICDIHHDHLVILKDVIFTLVNGHEMVEQ